MGAHTMTSSSRLRPGSSDGRTHSKSWKVFGSALLAILTAVAAFLYIATFWPFYPTGLIELLCLCLIAALSTCWVLSRRLSSSSLRALDEARKHDAGIVAKIRRTVSRDTAEWIRSWDFGGEWRSAHNESFRALSEMSSVEHFPIDPELQVAFQRLLDANRAFLDCLVWDTFTDHNHGEWWCSVGWTSAQAETLQGEDRLLWEGRSGRLNDAATRLVEAYDEFVGEARQKLLLC